MNRKVLAGLLVILAAIAALTITGCSCSSQAASSSSSSSSASSASASSSASSSSSAVGQVEVPNLVWLEQADAEKQLKAVGLALGDVTYENSDTVPSGLVISQKPDALSKADANTKVSLVVSKGKKAPVEVTVPNLYGLSQTDAENAIAQAKLIAVQDDPVVTDEVAPGLVCKQSIKAGTKVVEGSQISFATAKASNKVKVPDCVGEPYEGARDALKNEGLGCDKSTAYSDTVDKGIVISQSEKFGSEVDKGTVVTLKVSLGQKPEKKVVVPDVYTYTLEDAKNALESAGLQCRTTGEDNGTVIAMNPDAGTEVEKGTIVTIRLQHKSSTVEVPNIVGETGNNALVECQSLGLGLKYDESMGNEPLIAQNPAAGTLVDPGTVIEGTEPSPQPTKVEVPDVKGKTGDEAKEIMKKAGLEFEYDESHAGDPVESTKPAAGTEVDPGSVVQGIFKDKPQPTKVEIPDVSAMSGTDAEAALNKLGLELDYDESNPDKPLTGTNPQAGTEVDEGTVVNALYGEN